MSHPASSPARVWGLADEHSGQAAQALGVIAKLGVPYALKNLDYNPLGALPNGLLGASVAGLSRHSAAMIAPPWPKLIIASGRRTVPVLRYIKKKSPSTVAVYLMWPGSTRGIDLIVVPEHDEAPKLRNVITTAAPLHAVTPETLVAARQAWLPQFSHLPKPWVALAVGGDTKHGRYTAADWHALIKQSVRLAGSGSLLITTSRRTPPSAIDLITPLLQIPHLLHRWDTDKDNPYMGILGCADAIIVTGDSLSMAAEACVSGKPVFIFSTPGVTPEKYARFHLALASRGIARPLNDLSDIDWTPENVLDDAGAIAAEIRARFPQALA